MTILILLASFLFIVFAGIVLFGAPYVPSKRVHINAGFDLLDLKKGQTLIELGSGDGRVLREAARRGFKAQGYELNPILVLISLFVCRNYRGQVRIRLANYWIKDLSAADGVFIFSAGSYMKRLDKKLSNTKKSFKLVSVGFRVPGKKPTKTKDGVFLYQYR